MSRIIRALRIRWPDLELRTVDTARGCLMALTAASAPDAVFIPQSIADAEALALLHELRGSSDVVSFYVGSNGGEEEMVEGLEAGADDYINASMSESLIVARVCAALRRARRSSESMPPITCGELVIDPESHEVRLKGKPLYLTPTEFKLLHELAQNQGHVVTQRGLESAIWGSADNLYLDVLRKHVQHLRQKLEARPGVRTTITSVPRVGYKLVHNRFRTSRG